MKETDELEPQQYEQLYWEESVPVKDVRKSTLRKFIYIASIICIVFILIGLFIKFPDQVELPFILKSDQSEEIYRFSSPVYVMEKYIKPGDSIKKEQPLVKITSPEIAIMINNYREAEQKLLNFQEQKKISIEKQKEMIAISIKQNKSRISEIEHETEFLNSTWKSNNARMQYEYDNAIKRYEANKILFDNNIGSKFSFLDVEKSKIASADSLESATQNYEKEKNRLNALSYNYKLNNITANTELNKLSIDAKYDSISLTNQFTLAKDKIENTFGTFEISGGSLILHANQNAVVAYVFDGEKEVTPGVTLLKLLYNNFPTYAYLTCPPSMIGKIKKNQQAALKIASFPFYEWGTVKAHIDNISLMPDEKGNFSVKMIIDNTGKLNNLLQVGMNGNAIILLEEKTFYDYFFRRIKKLYYKTTMNN